jgi:ubiquitin-conjugating enzyme E2 J2
MGLKRLQREYKLIMTNPPPHIRAAPLPSNILTWHYVLYDLTDCPYEGGYYHGVLVFPQEYPLKPPAILMTTPNGRFQCNTRLCLSMSDFHPGLWNPAWSVESILKGLLSFMLETTPTTGSIVTSSEEKIALARQSAAFNLKDEKFRELFPELAEQTAQEIIAQKQAQRRQREVADVTQTTAETPNTSTSSSSTPLPSSPLDSLAGQAFFVAILALFSYIVYQFVTVE